MFYRSFCISNNCISLVLILLFAELDKFQKTFQIVGSKMHPEHDDFTNNVYIMLYVFMAFLLVCSIVFVISSKKKCLHLAHAQPTGKIKWLYSRSDLKCVIQ